MNCFAVAALPKTLSSLCSLLRDGFCGACKTPTNELRTPSLLHQINPGNAPGKRPEFIEGLSIPVSQNNAGEYLYPSGNLHILVFTTLAIFFETPATVKEWW